LIEPTAKNLKEYEKWNSLKNRDEIFFPDLLLLNNDLSTCQVLNLEAGNTIFLPSGWIHAVYTPEDSIVFGGNYLHSYAIKMQLKYYFHF
jgi:F-box/leucine-rich repeat protein 10/11